jgi:hypothetical protein
MWVGVYEALLGLKCILSIFLIALLERRWVSD